MSMDQTYVYINSLFPLQVPITLAAPNGELALGLGNSILCIHSHTKSQYPALCKYIFCSLSVPFVIQSSQCFLTSVCDTAGIDFLSEFCLKASP